jgi:cysteinyl-tRNA synthetase
LRDLLGIDLDDAWESLRPKTVEDIVQRLELGTAYDRSAFDNVISELVERRITAKKSKDFDEADRIRDALTEAGVILRDTSGGTDFELTPSFDPAKLEAIR